MLIKRDILDRIVSGQIDLVFRRWKRATVKEGGTLKTAVGILQIRSVSKAATSKISANDAHRAGYATRRQILEELAQREGDTYRIEVAYAGADPRIALRQQGELTRDEIDAIQTRLERMDARSTQGPWVAESLQLIRDNPGVRAPDLAARLGWETKKFKSNIRKLKELGLTESLRIGYRLSSRGETLIASLDL